MRTTVTVPDDLIEETKKATSTSSVSEAITKGLQAFVNSKKQMSLLEYFFENPAPHKHSKIKRDRKK